MDPRAEALLYAAARAQLVRERLRPLLDAGVLVLLDRFVDSSLAYQGAGRELGIEPRFARSTCSPPAPSLPTARCCCASPPPTGAPARTAAPPSPTAWSARTSAFFARIAAAYDGSPPAEPERLRVIDAAQPPTRVLADALVAIEDLL